MVGRIRRTRFGIFLNAGIGIVSIIVFLTAPLLHAAEAAKPSVQIDNLPEILVLNSYHSGYAWSDDEQAGVIDVLRAKYKNWLPVVEYLDMKRLPDGKHLVELKKLFRRKYQGKRFALVIGVDNPALDFAIDNQAELFGNAPIVFCGINNYTPALLKGRTDVTGIVEAIDIAGTIEVMLRLHPAAREIFVPHDYTVTGLAVRKEIEALVPRFGARVRFRFTDPMTMDELLRELERLPADSLVLEMGFLTDKSSRTFGISETTKLFYEHSPVPIYSTYEQRLGFGIVGGKLLSARQHGVHAASIVLQVLAGEKASAIPIVFESDSQFMFDNKVMSHFGIPLSALPEGSTVINKPASFYTAHREVILTALGIIGFLSIIIVLLIINTIQRKRSAEALRQSQVIAERLAEERAILAEISRVIGSTLDIEEVYERFATEARKLISFDRVSVNLINPGGKNFTIAYLSGFDIPGRRSGTILPIAGSISEVVMQTQSGRIIHVENPEDLARQFPSIVVSLVVMAGIRSLIGVPLIYRNKMIGNLHFRSKTQNAYTEQDLRLAERIGSQIAGAIGSAQLFLDRKRAEEKIRASLLEKETMFKEIHHRVKNNLQVISSLLSLQSSYLQDEKAIEALEESMDRVETMASIHAQLYESQDLNRVDFGGFIQELIGNIRQSYGRTEFPVEIKADAGEISLGIDNSIPCGLILNELVSNSLKHAFPKGKQGEINIRMRTEGKRVALTVCDNGIGFPESIDRMKVKTMGLDLVNLLVAQMNGEIEMRVEGGTTWTIIFPLKRDREWRNEKKDHDR